MNYKIKDIRQALNNVKKICGDHRQCSDCPLTIDGVCFMADPESRQHAYRYPLNWRTHWGVQDNESTIAYWTIIEESETHTLCECSHCKDVVFLYGEGYLANYCPTCGYEMEKNARIS